jgi:hypothetical protein
MKPGHKTTGNVRVLWSDESSFTLFPTSRSAYVWRRTQEAYNPKCVVSAVKQVGDSLMVCAAISWYSILLVPLLHFMDKLLQGSIWAGLGIEVQPMVQKLFPKDAVFQNDNAPIHTAGTVQSWFVEHKDELQHLPW